MDSCLSLLPAALLIGVTIAAPVGPITVLYVRRALANGWRSGMATALGAASADAVYAAIAAFGLSFLSDTLVSLQDPVRLVGGLFLLYLGARIFRARPAEQAAQAEGGSLARDYGSTLFLTLTNPMTILIFAGVFTGAGLAAYQQGGGQTCPAALVAGVFLGSMLWAGSLVTAAALFRARFTPRAMQWVNRISGGVIILFALATLAALWM
ncbi:MAG: LysE family translocator [Caldilineaceae bacterium]